MTNKATEEQNDRSKCPACGDPVKERRSSYITTFMCGSFTDWVEGPKLVQQSDTCVRGQQANKIDALQKELKDKEDQIARLQGLGKEITKKTEIIEDLQKSVMDRAIRIDELRATVISQDQTIIDLRRKIEELKYLEARQAWFDNRTAAIAELQKTITDLSKFKAFVHNWLDKHGVPQDPDPVRNITTGCRVGCRLDWLKHSKDMNEKKPKEDSAFDSVASRLACVEEKLADIESRLLGIEETLGSHSEFITNIARKKVDLT